MKKYILFFLLSCSLSVHASFHSVKDVQRDGGVNTITAMYMAGYINGSVCKQTALDLNDDGMFAMFDKMVKANIDYLVAGGITGKGQSYINTITSRYIFGLSLFERAKTCERIYRPLNN